ncbi:MAG: hypothetical protein J6O13_00775 [Selenomonas sp.]|nr:hypothetical protein [Selenomonas sp.]
MKKSRRDFRKYITEEHRNFMLRVFGTADIDEIDRRDAEIINYSDDKLMPYICGEYGEEDSELAEDITDFLYMVALPKVSDKHRKFMMDVFGTDNIEDIRRIDEKSEWNYVDNKIKPELFIFPTNQVKTPNFSLV